MRLRHKIIFVSYRWLQPERTPPLPDDEQNTVFKSIVKGVEEIMADTGWEEREVALWVDYACVNQDDSQLQLRACESILGYVARCETMLIVALGEEDGRALDQAAPTRYGRASEDGAEPPPALRLARASSAFEWRVPARTPTRGRVDAAA